jgi:hypothetical protein
MHVGPGGKAGLLAAGQDQDLDRCILRNAVQGLVQIREEVAAEDVYRPIVDVDPEQGCLALELDKQVVGLN